MNGVKIIGRQNPINPGLHPAATPGTPQVRILIIDDDPDAHRDFRLALVNESRPGETHTSEELAFQGSAETVPSKPPYRLEHALGGTDAFDEVKRSVAAGDPFQLAFVRIGIPGIDSAGLVARLWEIDSSIQIVLVTDHADRSCQNLHERLGCTDKVLLLKKPFEYVEVFLIASTLSQKWFLSRKALDQTKFQDPDTQLPGFPRQSSGPSWDGIVVMPFRACLSCDRAQIPLPVRRKFSHRCLSGAVQSPTGFNQADALFLRRTIEAVEKHMSDCEFDVEALSRMLFISRRQLLRKVMAVAGCAPNVLIRRLRLKRAAELLMYSGFTVSEITYAVGFSDLKHFRQVFREQYGMSPGHYARKTQNAPQ